MTTTHPSRLQHVRTHPETPSRTKGARGAFEAPRWTDARGLPESPRDDRWKAFGCLVGKGEEVCAVSRWISQHQFDQCLSHLHPSLIAHHCAQAPTRGDERLFALGVESTCANSHAFRSRIGHYRHGGPALAWYRNPRLAHAGIRADDRPRSSQWGSHRLGRLGRRNPSANLNPEFVTSELSVDVGRSSGFAAISMCFVISGCRFIRRDWVGGVLAVRAGRVRLAGYFRLTTRPTCNLNSAPFTKPELTMNLHHRLPARLCTGIDHSKQCALDRSKMETSSGSPKEV